jgi:hypothetical protein
MGVERAKGLVHQQDLRLHDQRAHQSHALAHAAGQGPRKALSEACEIGGGDRLGDPRLALRSGQARDFQAIPDIGLDRSPRENRVALEHIADFPVHLAGLDDIFIDQNASARARQQPRHHVEDGAFAAAGRTEQRHELALPHLERNIIDCGELTARRAKPLEKTIHRDANGTCRAGRVRGHGGQWGGGDRGHLYFACAASRKLISTMS